MIRAARAESMYSVIYALNPPLKADAVHWKGQLLSVHTTRSGAGINWANAELAGSHSIDVSRAAENPWAEIERRD
jgi:hypothetical protein